MRAVCDLFSDGRARRTRSVTARRGLGETFTKYDHNNNNNNNHNNNDNDNNNSNNKDDNTY